MSVFYIGPLFGHYVMFVVLVQFNAVVFCRKIGVIDISRLAKNVPQTLFFIISKFVTFKHSRTTECHIQTSAD